MKRPTQFSRVHWQAATIISVGVAVCIFLLVYRLGSLTSGLSHGESLQQASLGWSHLAHDPLGAPLSLLQWLARSTFPSHAGLAARLPGAVLGFVTVGCFAYILRRWYGVRTALYGVALFVFSSWFLHVSRLGTTEVLYLAAIPVLLATHIAWQRQNARQIMTFAAMAILCALLYVPGAVWLAAAYLVLQGRDVFDGWRQLHTWWHRGLLTVLCIILLAPLGYALWQTPLLTREWLGLPAHFASISTIVGRLADSLYYLFIHGPREPALWLDRLPVLTIFGMLMFAAGVIFYARHILAPRTRLLLVLFIIGAVLFALGGPVGYSSIIPIVYLVITGGVGYVLHEWLGVFPRNPLARSVGFAILAIAIALNCVYGFRAYFIAWPHNSATTAAFHERR